MKKRILIPISFSFSIRYLVRSELIYKLKEFCTPVVVLTWEEKNLIKELIANNIEVYVVEESKRGFDYSDIRRKIDYWFWHYKLKSPTRFIEIKYLQQFVANKYLFINKLREFYNKLILRFNYFKRNVFELEGKLLIEDSNYLKIEKIVLDLKIDAVFSITPFHKQEEFLLRAAYRLGKQMITSILSFDNIVKRGWIPVPFSTYMVWNQKMKQELLRIYHESANVNNIFVTGAVQFDFYTQPEKFLIPKEQWLHLIGINEPNRKIILYAGGPKSLFPQEYQFLQHIDSAISEGKIKGNPIVLFRCHPVDNVERWKEAVQNSKNIFFEKSWTGTEKLIYTGISHNDIAKLFSTLKHTDVHINVASTMAVDGSAFSKPQIGPAYDEIYNHPKYNLASMYLQEHFSPILNSGGLFLAYNRQEFIDLINRALEHPENFTAHSENLLKSVITYTDGKATDRVVEVLKNVL